MRNFCQSKMASSASTRCTWDDEKTDASPAIMNVNVIRNQEVIPVWNSRRCEFSYVNTPLRTQFVPLRFKAQKRKERGSWTEGEKRGSVTYSWNRESEISNTFIIPLMCVWQVLQRFLCKRNGFKFLTHPESKTSQFKIVIKFYLLKKLKTRR